MDRKQLIADIKINASVEYAKQRKPYSIVELRYGYYDRDYYGVGFSKVSGRDKWSAVIGMDIAFGRAVGEIYQAVKADGVCNG